VLGVGLVIIGCVIVFVASFVASGVLADLPNSEQEAAARQTVLDFDAAYEDQDCAGFRTVVTRDLADQLAGGDFDCRTWVAIADSLHDDNGYGYSVDVIDVTVTGNEAVVYTEEHEFDSDARYYNYTLERSDGSWVITRYDLE
jgi:hypothetical protein